MSFLDLAREGKNRWWRYLLSVILIFVLWQIVGGIPVAIAYFTFAINDPFWYYIVLSFTFVCFLAGILLSVRFIHQRPIKSLITPYPTVRRSRLVQGFVWWFILNIATTLVDYILHPATYSISFDAARWLLFAVFVLILTPIQTSTEELFFRGYLVQGFGLLTRNRLVLSLLSGVLFAIPHFLNPEMQNGFWLMALYYFSFGFFLAWITLRDNGLELALGIHASNNIFAALVVNYKDSALNTPSIFFTNTLDPVTGLVYLYASAVVLYAILFWRGRGARGVERGVEAQPPEGIH